MFAKLIVGVSLIGNLTIGEMQKHEYTEVPTPTLVEDVITFEMLEGYRQMAASA